jgi:hypothetical protein
MSLSGSEILYCNEQPKLPSLREGISTGAASYAVDPPAFGSLLTHYSDRIAPKPGGRPGVSDSTLVPVPLCACDR